MLNRNATLHRLSLLIMLALILGTCQGSGTPEVVVETLIVTQIVETTPIEVIQVVTPTPESTGERIMVICLGEEPETLYPYAGSRLTRNNILEAISEGSWSAYDTNSYASQPIILEKLPNLADGDATLTVVSVSEGDTVVDANGNVVTLDLTTDQAIMLTPAGGGDPVPYQGGDFELDQLSATFKLLPDLLWSDGTPLTAADSVYAFNLLKNPDTPHDKFTAERTSSYRAIDDQTTVWTGLPGFMDAEYETNFFGPAPEHIWGEYTASELITAEESSRTPIGWGPYIIDEWVPGKSITLHKNPNYFRADEGLPKFDNVVYRFVGQNSNANIAAILSGECDVVDNKSGLEDQTELLLELRDSDQINATFTPGPNWEHIDFGIQHREYDDGYQMDIDRPDFFSDARTRQAFVMCMDRQAVVDTILFRQSIVIDSYLPPQHPLYNSDVVRYGFDPEAGSALLEEVGWEDDDNDPVTARVAHGIENVLDGTKLEVAFETSSSHQRPQVAELIQRSLAQCGILTSLEIYNPAEWVIEGPEGKLFGRKFDLGQFAWSTPRGDPPCDLYLASQIPGPAGETWFSIQDGKEHTFGVNGWWGGNQTGFVDNEYEAVCNSALDALPGQSEYESAHLEAQMIFSEQLPVAPLYLHIKLAATRPDMCGFIPDPSAKSEFWNIEKFDYGERCNE